MPPNLLIDPFKRIPQNLGPGSFGPVSPAHNHLYPHTTAVAKFPCFTPDPCCVAVATAPLPLQFDAAMTCQDSPMPTSSLAATRPNSPYRTSPAPSPPSLFHIHPHHSHSSSPYEMNSPPRIRYPTERMPRPHRPHLFRPLHNLPNLLHRRRPMPPSRPKLHIPRPVPFLRRHADHPSK